MARGCVGRARLDRAGAESPSGWEATARNDGGSSQPFEVAAICSSELGAPRTLEAPFAWQGDFVNEAASVSRARLGVVCVPEPGAPASALAALAALRRRA